MNINGFRGMQNLNQSPVESEFVQNPYPFYDKAREFGDLFYWEDYGQICAVSFKSVNAILRDRRWGREVPEELKQEPLEHLKRHTRFERGSMLELEPPAHTRLRGLVARAFTSRRIAGLEPEIKELAESIVLNLGNREFELQKSLAERLPLLVIARLLGVPDEMADQLLSWSHDMVAIYQAKRNRQLEDQAETATIEFSKYIAQLVDDRRKKPRNDLISSLIAAEEAGQKLTDDEMISTCILLLNAGHEATAYSIGNGIKAIIESGEHANSILEPGQREATVEEILRYDPPLHKFERYAKIDLDAFGHRFRRGDIIALLLGAANRDPGNYSEPNRFRPRRKVSGHTSFGAGVHFCVGAPLARLEMAVALSTLFRVHPNLSLVEQPRYANRYHFHGLKALKAKP